jgi:nicotinamidase-related amidase
MVAISEGKVISAEFDGVRTFDHPALLVLNMQNGIVQGVRNKRTILPTIRDLVDAAHKTGVPIVYNQYHSIPSKWSDPRNEDDPQGGDASHQRGWMRMGATEWKIVPDLTPDESDLIIPAHTSSIFLDTPLEHVLRNYDIRTLILTGTASHSGILSTAQQALMLGFAVVLVENAVGEVSPDLHKRAMRLLNHGCEILPAIEVVERFNLDSGVKVITPPLLGPDLEPSEPEDLGPSNTF